LNRVTVHAIRGNYASAGKISKRDTEKTIVNIKRSQKFAPIHLQLSQQKEIQMSTIL